MATDQTTGVIARVLAPVIDMVFKVLTEWAVPGAQRLVAFNSRVAELGDRTVELATGAKFVAPPPAKRTWSPPKETKPQPSSKRPAVTPAPARRPAVRPAPSKRPAVRPAPPKRPAVKPAPRGPARNLARGRPTTQSSVAAGGAASRAVDGNTSGVFGQRSVTHTQMQHQPWWQVDLGANRQIDEIRIWNRTDCCSTRLSRFAVIVSGRPFARAGFRQVYRQAVWKKIHRGRASKATRLRVGRSGRYLRIQLLGRNALSLAEVQVLGR